MKIKILIINTLLSAISIFITISFAEDQVVHNDDSSVYHNGTIIGSTMRSVCIGQFKNNADNTFPTVNMTTNGPAQVSNFNPYETTLAETICWESDIETEKCNKGGLKVCSVENGDYIIIKGVDFGDGATSFIAHVASAASGGTIELRINSLSGPLVGTCVVRCTGGWQTWATKTCTVTGATGLHDLYFKFTGGSGTLFNFNWWKLNPITAGTGSLAGNCLKNGSSIKIITNAGKVKALHLDISPSIPDGKLSVCLFDLSGQLVTALFKGQLNSRNLIMPFDRAGIRQVIYVIRASIDKKIIFAKTIDLSMK